ncbi:hypothetical protein V4210_01455 [Candidatus Nanosynbacter sp. BB002]|uniref:hypothetical protein n=1 Tax=Candidatus Nanosynbacter sp. BB002 TaxID=3393757 RepID=UPI0030CEFC1B
MSSGDSAIPKGCTNPISASGDGYVFEHSVQAFFVIQMITGGLVPRMDNCEVTRIVFQAERYGRKTDDCEVTLKDLNNPRREKTLLVQVKRKVRLSNGEFTKTIKDAWNDFNSQSFNRNSDRIMLVTGELEKSGIGLKNILTHIQSSYQSADQFWENYDNNVLGRNKDELNGLRYLREKLTLANNNIALDREVEFEFLKSFFIIKSDMHENLFEDGDINVALIHSILAQKKWKDNVSPKVVWERLCHYVATRNKDQIELLKDDLPKKLLEIFKEEKVIRQDDVVSLQDENQLVKKAEPSKNKITIKTAHKKELALLCLIGEFDSANSNDKKIVSELLRCDEDSLLDVVQEINSTDDQVLELRDTTWKVLDIKSTVEQLSKCIYDNHIDVFADIYLRILSEINPALDLPIDERYMANIYKKSRAYSATIRTGVANGMAMLANNQGMFSKCSANKIANTANNIVSGLLSDSQNPKLWMSITDNASLIAQASPVQFLSRLESTLKIKNDNPIATGIKESSGDSFFQPDYMTGLYWALADLSWDKKYFSRASLVLAKIATLEIDQTENKKRSLDTILHTILPWQPKTLAPLEVQHGVVEKIVNEHKAVGRELLKGLLPNMTQTTMERKLPEWLDITNTLQPVTQQELWKESSYYSNLYIDTTESLQEIVDAINSVNHLTDDTLPSFTNQLNKRLQNMTDKDRQVVWEVLLKKINNLDRRSKDEDERVKILKKIASDIEPEDDLCKSIYLFSNYDHDLIGYNDWEKGKKELEEKQRESLLKILNSDNAIRQLNELINQAKMPYTIGSSLGSINYPSIENMLLPKFLNENKAEKEFISNFIYTRYFYYKGDINWVNKLDFASWNNEQKILLLLALPFSQSTWDLLDAQQNKDLTKGYWDRVDNFRHTIDDKYSEAAVRNLLKAKRPLAAIEYIASVIIMGDSSIKQQIDPELCLKALMASLNTTENISGTNNLQYEIGRVFKYLYDNIDYTRTNLWEAEWGCISLFGKHGIGQPRALIYRIANDADFFCDLIKTAYKSELPDVKQQEIDDAIQYRLLKILSFNDFMVMPGIDQYGTFREDDFITWIYKVEEICKMSGHLGIAQSVIGGYLINSPEDKSGLWINKTVARILDRNDSVSMRSGYNMGIHNARGMHVVDETGEAEASLRDKWRNRANEIESLGFINLATSLRELAETYERERNRIIKQERFRD